MEAVFAKTVAITDKVNSRIERSLTVTAITQLALNKLMNRR